MVLLTLRHTSGLRLTLSAEPRADGRGIETTVRVQGHRVRMLRWRRTSLAGVVHLIAICQDECRPPDWIEIEKKGASTA